MSYYDGLGVGPNASQEEIREAYRTLARLFHPDQQTDPVLKRAAEGQMRRINECYEALSDPEKRRRYDMRTDAPAERATQILVRPAVVVRTRLSASSIAWIGAAVASVGVICWLSVQGQPRATPPVVSANAVPKRPAAEAVVREAEPEKPERKPTARDRAMPVASIERRAAGKSDEEQNSFWKPLTPPAEVTGPEIAANFGGFWAYPHARDVKHETGHYPPEFIETAITETGGRIRGKYRARYYISDQLISPNVNFEFEGEPNGPAANLPWHGEGGSKGIVQIRLVTENEMEVAWKATDRGEELGLVSGTAILMRRPE